MSRSNNTEVKSPSNRYFEWQGKGKFKYYDKTLKDQPSKGIVEVPYPFRFIVLDQLVTIKGYSDPDQSGFYSNEIRDKNLKTAILTVKTKKGLRYSGTYEQVIKELGAEGASYCKSVYVGYFDESNKLVIGNIQIHGAAIGAWIDFCKAQDVMKIGVQVKSHIEAKKGNTIYQIPVFEALPIKEETNIQALELDKQLQEYLKSYFNRDAEETTTTNSEAKAVDSPQTHGGSKSEQPIVTHDPEVSAVPDPEDIDPLPF